MQAVATGLAAGDSRRASPRELVALRYYRRFLDEVCAHEEARAEAAAPAAEMRGP